MTYEELNNYLVTMDTSILSGENTVGEDVVILRLSYNCILLLTSQNNGWLRVNCYWEDGIVVETYSKKRKILSLI